jgi:hypothetical protein
MLTSKPVPALFGFVKVMKNAIPQMVLVTATAVSFQSGVLMAESASKELPTGGLLAGSRGGFGNTSVGDTWGEGAEGGAPITASCNQAGGAWAVKLFNNSEDKYRVSVKVMVFNNANKQIDSSSVSGTLAAKSSLDRSIRGKSGGVHCDVQLVSWKRTEKEKSKEEANAELEAAKAKVAELEKAAGVPAATPTPYLPPVR